jgi:hyperosmotically inducible periplasmic protein
VPSVAQALNQWRAVLGGVQIVRNFTGGKTMKVDYKNIIRTFLCIGLLLGVGVLTHAQEPNNQAPPASDNTKTNQRDRSANEPTADQQRDSRSDRDITQQIRRAIINDKSLSTYAHNVKVITQRGQVTLKGPVQSEDEKKSIEAKAAEVVGENKVSSELNVKPQQ